MSPALFGHAAGVFSVLGYVPYVGAVLRDRHKPANDPTRCLPKRASWIIWAATSWIILATMKANASEFAIDQAWAYAFGATATLILAFVYGTGGWSTFDRVCFAGALSGLLVWWQLHSAWYAFAIAMSVDAIGTLPIIKARGQGESPLAWLFFFLGCVANLGTVWALDDRSLRADNAQLADVVYPFGMTLIVVVPACLAWYAYRAAGTQRAAVA